MQGTDEALTGSYSQDLFLRDQNDDMVRLPQSGKIESAALEKQRVVFFLYLYFCPSFSVYLVSYMLVNLLILTCAFYSTAFIPHLLSQLTSREESPVFFLDGCQHIRFHFLNFFPEVLIANVFVVTPPYILKTGLPVILHICVK